MINARDKCPQCKKPIFLRGISEDRPIFACGCGSNMVGISSFDGCNAWSLDLYNHDLDEKPVMRGVSGEALSQGHLILAWQEIDELVETYPEYAPEFKQQLRFLSGNKEVT